MNEKTPETVLELQKRGVLRVEDGNHGEYRPRSNEFVDEGTAFIRAADMDDGRVLFNQASKINLTALKRITKGIGEPGDVIISHKGTVGRVARAPKDAPPFVCSPQTTFWRSTNEEELNQDFLYVLIRSPSFQRLFSVRAGETDMAGYVSLTSQRQLELKLPPIDDQISIAEAVKLYDDKIQLNRRMNETLEAMARAVFKDWFVDFGPTRRKAAGETDPVAILGGLLSDPAKATSLAALFPDCFGDDGLPEGWEERTCADFMKILDSKRVPLSAREREKKAGSIPYHGATSVMGFVDEALFDEILLLVGEDGSVVRSDGTPFTQYIWGKSWVNNHAHVLKGAGISTEQLKVVFDQIQIQPFVTGAVQAKLNQKNMKTIPFVFAGQEIHQAYDELIVGFFELIRNNAEENQTLAATRDLLLPKLMSGEIRLKDAEAVA